MGTSKQDRQGARTAQDIERKYNFGESFAEVYNIATGARATAEEAKETAKDAKDNPNLDHEAVFNALTEDGKCQGLYRDPENGNVYLNAEFIKSGVFTGETEMFIEPGIQEFRKIKNHNEGLEDIPDNEIPLYDFNGNGIIDGTDRSIARYVVYEGYTFDESLALHGIDSWDGKQLSTVKIKIDVHNPTQAISFTATNMWGRCLDYVVGINQVIFTDDGDGHLYRMVGDEKEWLNPPFEFETEYRTTDRIGEDVLYKLYDFDKDRILWRRKGTSVWHFDDYLVESGTLYGWYYEKWASGKAECWKIAEHTGVPITKTFGSLYVSIPTFYEDFPITFSEPPVCNVDVESDYSFFIFNGGGRKTTETSTKGVYVSRPSTLDSVDFALHWHAIGKWK